ncbi:hypothetical protein B277_01524 [Janibacter hoylei PVAS-1]|uniref:FtsX-like permease family protein n=1 Tax=Janibacter hoylei PVAS-1 TaxID=1210046 RepID=K1E5Y9_9MICO|nr:hypothetical protein [Janibacter hoylei]EKA62516.1 hypothetical protein B277_01524 [Janibacter hoylei PVAS-1]RWU84733.1 hypothetical protein CWN80_03930 [Janibacter hoylei PVAS-1]
MSLAWSEAARLGAKGGPADRLRRGLMLVCSALGAVLAAAAATVPSQWGEGVGNSSVLGLLLVDRDVSVGVLVALLVMALPVAHLAVQAVQVGAPARDRRLMALRAAGATLADVRRVVRTEALVWCSLGAAPGLVTYVAALRVAPHVLQVQYADREDEVRGSGELAGTVPVLGLDVWPHPLVLVAAAAAIPCLASLLVPRVVRRAPVLASAPPPDGRPMSPRLAAIYLGSAVVAGACVLAMIFVPVAGDSWQGEVMGWLFVPFVLATFVLGLCTLVVLASGTAARVGRVLVRRGGAVGLLAGRRMQAQPGLASRSAVSLVLVGFVAGLAVPLQGVIESEYMAQRTDGGSIVYSVPTLDLLYYSLPVVAAQVLAVVAGGLAAIGLLVAVAEQVSLRGADLARQVALGVPRRVIRTALVVETATPAAVVTTVALLLGAAVPVLSVTLTGNASLLGRVEWARLAGIWVALLAAVGLAAWVGGRALPSATGARRIRDRE